MLNIAAYAVEAGSLKDGYQKSFGLLLDSSIGNLIKSILAIIAVWLFIRMIIGFIQKRFNPNGSCVQYVTGVGTILGQFGMMALCAAPMLLSLIMGQGDKFIAWIVNLLQGLFG